MAAPHPTDLPELMKRARMRIAHLWLGTAAIMAAISTQIAGSSARMDMRVIWFLGCAIILGLGALWYRSRDKATRRLLDVVGTGAIRSVRATRVLLYFVPFGYEVDVDLQGDESLSFGFWSRRDFERLQTLLK